MWVETRGMSEVAVDVDGGIAEDVLNDDVGDELVAAARDDGGSSGPMEDEDVVVHGEIDDLIPIETTSKLATKLNTQKNIEVEFATIKGANHFYENKIDALKNEVVKYLDTSLSKTLSEPKKKITTRKRK
mgnify:CR=1 FL=1